MTGVGASKKWDGNQIKGKITITKSVSSNTIEFDIPVAADSEITLTYGVRYTW
jgi:hypothetical protein